MDFRPIGIRDDFFALGGHSILAVRMVALVEQDFGRTIPLATLLVVSGERDTMLREPFVAGLAEQLRASLNDARTAQN